MDLSKKIGIHRYSNGRRTIGSDALASECLIRLYSGTELISSLLGTPTALEALLVGHAVSEGLGSVAAGNIHIHRTDSGSYEVTTSLNISPQANPNRIVTSSCGACNSEGLDELIDGLPSYSGVHSLFSLDDSFQALQQMRTHQHGFKQTGGMHAAALWNAATGVHCVSEDIGRHNAVDKVIGHAFLRNIPLNENHLLLSGRCGWDLVAKAARSGIGTIVCVGACSSLAGETARRLGIRVFSFMKEDGCVAIGPL